MKKRAIVIAFDALLLLGLALIGSSGFGKTEAQVGTTPTGVQVTVYNNDIGVVQETRTITLTSVGVNTLQLTDVPTQIDPETVRLVATPDPAALVPLEQNYEYDLASSARLLQKYIGREIRVVTKDGTAYLGTLLAADENLVLQGEDGSVDAVSRSEIKAISFPKLPQGLTTKPSLVWLLSAAASGRQTVTLSYVTHGLAWKANYVAHLSPDNRSMDLAGWVVLDNRSGKTFRRAHLKLVAGQLHQAKQVARTLTTRTKMVETAAAPAPVTERQFSEYHLYDVPRPVTIASAQSKQVQFVTAAKVPTEKLYVLDLSNISPVPYRPATDQSFGISQKGNANVYIQFKTGEKSHLDLPLPAGRVRLYQQDQDGALLLVGEDNIRHTPISETVRLQIGQAFDVTGERQQTNFNKLGRKSMEESFRISVQNHKSEAVTVRVVEHLYRWNNWTITDSNPAYTKLDSQTIVFELPLKANGEGTVSYTVLYRW